MTRMRSRLLTRLVAVFTAQCLIGSNLVLAAAQIVVDGQTQTQLHVHGPVTDVTTRTVRGANAYNSFSKFDVHRGNTVNLHVPGSAQNLINLVHDKGTRIDGVLNSYHRGEIGGNVYFANPHGVVVGASGVVNVGALSVTTPTKPFMDGFIDGAGNPSAAATQQVLDGTAPINPNARIDIRGQVNARGDIRLRSAHIEIAGALDSLPAPAAGHALAAPLNTGGLQDATHMVERNGEIWILADGDASVTGSIRSDGADGFDAGGVTVRAGNDIAVSGDAVISARGNGSESDGGRVVVFAERDATLADRARVDVSGGDVSGDGGFAEFSAKRTVTIDGGSLQAGASDGRNGEALVDPLVLNINTPQLSGGGNQTFQADEQINIAPGTLISSRNIGSAGDHANAASQGDSGDMRFEAPEINVAPGVQIFAHAINQNGTGFAAGDILFKADGAVIDVTAGASGTMVDVLESIIDVANPPSLAGLFDALLDTAQGRIDIDGATIRGGDVTLTASGADRLGFDKQATASIRVNDTQIRANDVTMTATADTSLLPAQNDPSGSIDIEEVTSLVLDLGATPFVSLSSSQAEVRITGNSAIDASGDVSIAADATSKAKQIAPGLLFSIGYGVSNAKAVAELADNAVVTAGGDLAIDATTNSIVDISATSRSLNKPVDLTYVESTTEATTFAGSGNSTRITAGSVAVNATTNLDIATSGSAEQVGGSSAGLAIVQSDLASETDAVLAGVVDSRGAIDVTAVADMEQNVTRADSASLGSTGSFSTKLNNKIAGIQRNMAAAVLSQFTGSSTTIANFLFPGIRSGRLNISGALAFADTVNNVRARIADAADVRAGGPIRIDARVNDDFNLGAVSQTSSDGAAFGGAVAIGEYVNDARAWVGQGALVDTGSALDVTAATTLEYPWAVDWGNLEDVLNHVTGNIEDLLFTSYAFNNSKGRSGSLSASVDVIDLDATALAWIDGAALINQRGSSGDVNVLASHDLNFVQAVGTSVPFSFINRLLGKSPSRSGFGGSAGFVSIDADARAWVADDVRLAADDVSVAAQSTQRLIQLAKAGGTTSDLGVAGTLTHSRLTGTVSAGIEASADVAATGDVDVSADSEASNLLIAGAVISGGNAGIGASISFANADTTTKAWIGDDDGDGRRGGTVSAGNAVTVEADGLSDISTYSVAAATASGVASATDTSGAQDKGKGKFGLGFAGDVSFNDIAADVFADVADGSAIDAAALTVGAHRSGDIFAFSGSAAYASSVAGSSAGLAGAYSQNIITGTTRASISDALVDVSGALSVDADTVGDLWSIAAGGSAAPKPSGLAIAGQVSYNEISNQTLALIDNAQINQAGGPVGDVTLDALDDSDIRAVTAAVAFGGRVGFGASVAISEIANTTRAAAHNSPIRADRLALLALNDSFILSVAAAGGFSSGTAGVGGAVSINEIANTTEATLSADATPVAIVSDTAILLSAVDADAQSRDEELSDLGNDDLNTSEAPLADSSKLKILSVAAGIAGAARTAVGAAGSHNTITNNVRARATGVDLTARNGDVTLNARASAATLAIAAGVAGAGQVGVSGSVAINKTGNGAAEPNLTEAVADGGASLTAAAGDVQLFARNDTTLQVITGAAAGAGSGAVSASGSYNEIRDTTRVTVDGATLDAARSVRLVAASDAVIKAIAAGGSAAGNVAFAGSIALNFLRNRTEALVSGDATITADHSATVEATADNAIEVIAGVLSLSGSTGVGGAVAVNDLDNDTRAAVAGSATRIEATGNGDAVQVDSGLLSAAGGDLAERRTTRTLHGVAVVASATDRIDSIVANVAGGGSAGVAASVGVNLVGGSTEATVTDASLLGGASPAATQQTLVGAHHHARVRGAAGGGAFGGTAGVGGASDTTVITHTTRARTDNATLRAQQALALQALSSSDVQSITVGAGLSGTVGASGSVSVVRLAGSTAADAHDSRLTSTGDLLVAANDAALSQVIAGSAAIGLASGIGAGVAVQSFDHDTTATLSGTSALDAAGTTVLLADSTKAFDNYAATISAAGSVGVAGTVAVTTVNGETSATVGGGSAINRNLGGTAQDVRIAANDALRSDSKVGGVAVGLGAAGVGAAVDVLVAGNTTSAQIAPGAEVNAGRDIGVDATTNRDVDSIVIAAAGGATVGIGGAVAVINVGSRADSDARSEADNGGDGSVSEADRLASRSAVGDQLDSGESASGESTGNSDRSRATVAVKGDFDATPLPSQRTAQALVGGGSRLDAGGALSVTAANSGDVDVTSVGVGVSAGVSLGGGIAVVGIDDDVSAALAGDVSAGGDVDVRASDRDLNTSSIETYAGGAGAVGLGASVAIVDKSSSAAATIAAGSLVREAGDITVDGRIDHAVEAKALQASIGLAGVGASVARATTGGRADAVVGDNVRIGGFANQAVNGLAVTAFAETDTTADTLAVAGGILSGNGSDARATTSPTVVAAIGNDNDITVADDVRVRAGASTDAFGRARGFSGGAVDVGASIADAAETTVVRATIGRGSVIDAGGDIQLLAYHNWTPGSSPALPGSARSNRKIEADAEASGGALLTVKGSEANASATVDTLTSVADDVVLLAGGEVSSQSLSSGNVDAFADSFLGGVLAGGTADANATLNHSVQSLTGNDVRIIAGADVTVSAIADSRARAQTAGGVGGLLAAGGTTADVVVSHLARVALGARNTIVSDRTVTLQARSDIDASSETDITSGGAVTLNQTAASARVTADTEIAIGDQATITAQTIVVDAEVTRLRVSADAFSETVALNSTSEADTQVDVESKVVATVGNDVTLTGRDRVAISAIHAVPDIDAISTTKAAGATGSTFSVATANLDVDADVVVNDGTTIFTDDLYVAALAFEAEGMWNRDANAIANTVVNWVLTTVDVLVKEVSKIPIIGWFVKWVWKRVSKWVAEITNSESEALLRGTLAIENAIQFDADVFQLSSTSPELIVDSDGNIVRDFLVDARREGDEIIVDDLINAGRGKVLIDASNGLLFGDGRVFVNNAYETVTLENNSDLDLRINDIDIASDHLVTPDVEFFSSNDFDLEIVAGVERSSVIINNTSTSDVIIAGLIENPFGDTTIVNRGGDILSTGNGIVQSNALRLSAHNGAIGTAGQRLAIQLAAGEETPRLDLLANHDVFLDVTLVDFLGSADTVVARTAIIDGVLAAGDVDVLFNDGRAFVLVDSELPPEERPFVATYRIDNRFAAGGDVTLDGTPLALIALFGTLSSGFADIVADIGPDGTIDDDAVDYLADDGTAPLTIETLGHDGGNIAISGNLVGTGTVQVLDGYSRVAITNRSPFDLAIADIDLGTPVSGSIVLNGVAVDPKGGGIGTLGVATSGYSEGGVSVTNSGPGNVLLGGLIDNPSGVVHIANSGGDIVSRGASQRLVSRAAVLDAGAQRVALDKVVVDDGLTVIGDTIALPDVEHSGSTLVANIAGSGGTLADSVNLGLTSRGSATFNDFRAVNAGVTSTTDRLRFDDALLGEVATVDTPLHRIVVDNINRRLHPNATGQLHSPGRAFDLQLLAERRFLTNAFLINFDPDFIANVFSTENSLTRLNVKRDTLPELTSDALEVDSSIVEAIVLAGIMSDQLAPAAGGPVNYDAADDDSLLGITACVAARSVDELLDTERCNDERPAASPAPGN